MTHRRMRKAIFLLLTAVFLLPAGCGDGTADAENAVRAYFAAVSGFNIDAMDGFLSEGTHEDFGIDTAALTDGERSDTYKKAVTSMFQSLGRTVTCTIDASEQTDKDTVVVRADVGHADVESEAVDAFVQQAVDDFIEENPTFAQLTAERQDDVAMEVTAAAYQEFLSGQPSVSHKMDITVVRVDNQWKILNGAENQALMTLLADLFRTY